MDVMAAFGVGAAVVALLGWLGIRTVLIFQHRQRWIDALREDLVLCLEEIEQAHIGLAGRASERDQPEQWAEPHREAMHAARRTCRRLLLRLSTTSRDHVQLADLLEELLEMRDASADKQRIDAIFAFARKMLEEETAKAKFGIFTVPVTAGARWWRDYSGAARAGARHARTRRRRGP